MAAARGQVVASVFSELKRRHVYRAAVFYAGAAWLLVQVATQVAPYFAWPNWTVRLVIIAVVAFFPLAMLVSWYYDWSPSEGWRRESAGADAEAASARAGSVAVPGIASAPPSDHSIAVLSFVDMSQDKDQEYFSDGLAEELLNLLAQLPQLRVIARTSSFAFKGRNADVATIAAALNVANVLEGSVRKSGSRLRVTAQLIRASDSCHVWSQNFDRELDDVFAVQDEIARAVVEALKVKLLPEQHLSNAHSTRNTEAYEAYLLGLTVLRRGRYDDSKHALSAFEHAVALDPQYAAAWAGLARAQSAVADYKQDFEESCAAKLTALTTAERAIRLAPELADGYVIRGQLRYRVLWDWPGAIDDLRRGLELDPGSSDARLQYGLALHNLGRMDEAVAMSERVIADDPLSWLGWLFHGALLRNCGRFAEGRRALQRSLQINPQASWTRHVLGCLELLDGRTQLALEIFREAGAPYREAGIAMAEHTLGHEDESKQTLARIETTFGAGFAHQIAEAHAWRGDTDAAFAWLERACEQRDSGIARLRSEPMMRSLHGDPRWSALLRKLKFPE
jgi:serine/threonine-protein kinase